MPFCQGFDISLLTCYNPNMSIENQLLQEYLQNDLESQLEDYRLRLEESKIKHQEWSKNASTAVAKRDFKKEADAIDKILESGELTKQVYFKYLLSKLLGIPKTPYCKLYEELKPKPNKTFKENRKQIGGLELNQNEILGNQIDALGGQKVDLQFSPPDEIKRENKGGGEVNVNLNQFEAIIIKNIADFKIRLELMGIEFQHLIGKVERENLSKIPYHLISFELEGKYHGVLTNFGKASSIYFLNGESEVKVLQLAKLSKKNLKLKSKNSFQCTVEDLEISLEKLLTKNGIDIDNKLNLIIKYFKENSKLPSASDSNYLIASLGDLLNKFKVKKSTFKAELKTKIATDEVIVQDEKLASQRFQNIMDYSNYNNELPYYNDNNFLISSLGRLIRYSQLNQRNEVVPAHLRNSFFELIESFKNRSMLEKIQRFQNIIDYTYYNAKFPNKKDNNLFLKSLGKLLGHYKQNPTGYSYITENLRREFEDAIIYGEYIKDITYYNLADYLYFFKESPKLEANNLIVNSLARSFYRYKNMYYKQDKSKCTLPQELQEMLDLAIDSLPN
jgi:hypothetical protein